MINPIEYALKKVKGGIPTGILERTFRDHSPMGMELPWETTWRSEVVTGRVLGDCNLHGGQLKGVTLKSSWIEPTTRKNVGSSDAIVYQIPENELEGSEIAALGGLCPPTQYAQQMAGSSPHTVQQPTIYSGASALMDAVNMASRPQTPGVHHLSGNLVKVHPAVTDYDGWILFLRLCFTENLTNMSLSEIGPFASLVLAATKSYIYTHLILELETEEDAMGAEIGTFRDIIEGYEPEEDDYNERLKRFAGGSMMNPARLEYFLYHAL